MRSKPILRSDFQLNQKMFNDKEIAQWMKHLPCKREGQSLDLQNMKLGVGSHPCNANTPVERWEVETKESLETCRPDGLAYAEQTGNSPQAKQKGRIDN